ncbi:MAG TPA: DegT/DnrJ/EryC1/StrS aminotransferase family protein [Burkholderiales bacterium]|nr:DegT/DnrJ/EryC1/StrS aminotransferase family protein [Burkholderiales bacterium]
MPIARIARLEAGDAALAALAIEGGTPVRTAPLPSWPHFAEDELDAVRRVLVSGRANYWTGTQCESFEREFAGYVGARHAIALANGTVALELALHALGIGEGDEVIVPARSFVASAGCVVLRGARPVFADVDAVSGNISADTVRPVVTARTRAIIAVHLAGWPCEMEPLMALARSRNIRVIEDCAQSHGAAYRGRITGSFGDVAAFSFCQDKIMTTGGEGGMLVTNDELAWRRAWAYKDHGKSYDAVFKRKHPPGFRWLHESFGTNWRMTEMQAAIGRRQLTKLPGWIATRRGYARLLDAELAGVPGLTIHTPAPPTEHAYYKYYAFIDPALLAPEWSRERIIAAINAEGVPCAEGSCSEIYLEQAFTDSKLGPATRLPAARALGETSLMLMVHPTLREHDVRETAYAVRKVMTAATGG